MTLKKNLNIERDRCNKDRWKTPENIITEAGEKTEGK